MKAAIAHDQKHPIVLHYSEYIAKLVCTEMHIANLHIGLLSFALLFFLSPIGQLLL